MGQPSRLAPPASSASAWAPMTTFLTARLLSLLLVSLLLLAVSIPVTNAALLPNFRDGPFDGLSNQEILRKFSAGELFPHLPLAAQLELEKGYYDCKEGWETRYFSTKAGVDKDWMMHMAIEDCLGQRSRAIRNAFVQQQQQKKGSGGGGGGGPGGEAGPETSGGGGGGGGGGGRNGGNGNGNGSGPGRLHFAGGAVAVERTLKTWERSAQNVGRYLMRHPVLGPDRAAGHRFGLLPEKAGEAAAARLAPLWVEHPL
ncbi:MAG: hypothetical protein M1826_004845 [Phylliscum demangeonii]|nr:MAG: hypothetical protein M1826_004845 [Phylliscum demangeonii]